MLALDPLRIKLPEFPWITARYIKEGPIMDQQLRDANGSQHVPWFDGLWKPALEPGPHAVQLPGGRKRGAMILRRTQVVKHRLCEHQPSLDPRIVRLQESRQQMLPERLPAKFRHALVAGGKRSAGRLSLLHPSVAPLQMCVCKLAQTLWSRTRPLSKPGRPIQHRPDKPLNQRPGFRHKRFVPHFDRFPRAVP